jgi:hypothetical protein
MLAALRTRPGMWRALASDGRKFAVQALVAALRGAADSVDGTYEFDSRQTDEFEYTAYGRFVAPGPQEALVDQARDVLDESFRRLIQG